MHRELTLQITETLVSRQHSKKPSVQAPDIPKHCEIPEKPDGS